VVQIVTSFHIFEKEKIVNRQLLLPYFAPYLAYVALAMVPERILAVEWSYALRLVLVPGLLIWAWRWYPSLKAPKSLPGSIGTGLVAGLVGFFLWIILLSPFVEKDGGSWSVPGFFLRLAAATLVVPVFEELLMRGFILRLALQWDQLRKAGQSDALSGALDEKSVNDVAPGQWSVWAVAISTIAFTAGHTVAEWPAAVAYGLLMALLWIVRKDLISCIIAHAVTNFVLAVYVFSSGRWELW